MVDFCTTRIALHIRILRRIMQGAGRDQSHAAPHRSFSPVKEVGQIGCNSSSYGCSLPAELPRAPTLNARKPCHAVSNNPQRLASQQEVHDAKTLTFESTLPVAITQRMPTLAASSSLLLAAPFVAASPFATGTSLMTPGAQRILLTK